MPYATPLTDAEATAALAALPGWTREGEAISRTFRLPTFRDSIALVNAVADAAEEADHHPLITINWRRVTFALTTHAAKALTQKDIDMARQIDALAAPHAPIESAGR